MIVAAAAMHAVMAPHPSPPGDAYLSAALARIESLLRCRAVLWRHAIAAGKSDHLWGVPQVSDAEADALVALPPLGFLAPPVLPPAARAHLDAAVAAASGLALARAAATDSRLLRLEAAFALDHAARDLLLVAVLPELDQRYRRLLGYVMDDASQPWPSVELALALLAPMHGSGNSLRRALAADAPLRADGLVELAAPSGGGVDSPRAQWGLRAAPATVAWLHGDNALDAELLPGAEMRAVPRDLPVLDSVLLAQLVAAGQLARTRELRLILLVGGGAQDSGPSSAVARSAGRPLLRVDLGAERAEAVDTRLAAALRTARLAGAILRLDGLPMAADNLDPAARPGIARRLARHPLPVVVTAERAPPPSVLPPPEQVAQLALRVSPPGIAERRELWRRALAATALAADADPPGLAGELADRFRLGETGVARAVAVATAAATLRDRAHATVSAEELFRACRGLAVASLGGLARHVPPEGALELDDLVLPPPARRRLDEFVARLRQRRRVMAESHFDRRLPLGRGTVALFAGPAGTGKTLAALMIGRALGCDLFKADLAALVSKWVGETEKHLDRLFAEAEAADALLFFDEADALFGRRGEVKEARDRWANLETNYLLQRVEDYDGVVILATNLRQSLDEAFLRRIDVVLEFPFPDAALRARLWQSLLPAGLPGPDETEIARLAEALPMAGGNIKTIAVDAAFRALADADAAGTPPRVELRHVVIAAAREYEKLGKPVTAAEFSGDWLDWARAERAG